MTGGGDECAAQGLCAPVEWYEWEAAGDRKAFAIPGSVLLLCNTENFKEAFPPTLWTKGRL